MKWLDTQSRGYVTFFSPLQAQNVHAGVFQRARRAAENEIQMAQNCTGEKKNQHTFTFCSFDSFRLPYCSPLRLFFLPIKANVSQLKCWCVFFSTARRKKLWILWALQRVDTVRSRHRKKLEIHVMSALQSDYRFGNWIDCWCSSTVARVLPTATCIRKRWYMWQISEW